MRLLIVLAAASFVALAGLVMASSTEQTHYTIQLDLRSAGGPELWLRCAGPDAAHCGLVTPWLQSNGVEELQISIFSYGNKPWDPDTKLLP